MLSADQFLPHARGGDLRALDEWALVQACTDFVKLRRSLGDQAPDYLAVNLSAATLTTRFDRLVERVLADTDLAASQLVLELSEQTDFDALTAAVSGLERLRRLGVRMLLDDMGCGISTLRHLTINAIDGLKIDATFVNGMLGNHRQHTVVKLLADLGRNLSVPVIAEGVETADQLTALARLNIEYAQGYYIGRPQPLSTLTAQITKTRETTQAPP
jgi:EAL domain-containing protein (putative c-di-GMP-specific phosphodiesterase class I)